MTAYMVAGTQAAKGSQNKVTVFKVSNINQAKQEDDEGIFAWLLYI
jgi:hypothetical protein